eukprot:9950146-Alexandrium_andersonii.AAC.1
MAPRAPVSATWAHNVCQLRAAEGSLAGVGTPPPGAARSCPPAIARRLAAPARTSHRAAPNER